MCECHVCTWDETFQICINKSDYKMKIKINFALGSLKPSFYYLWMYKRSILARTVMSILNYNRPNAVKMITAIINFIRPFLFDVIRNRCKKKVFLPATLRNNFDIPDLLSLSIVFFWNPKKLYKRLYKRFMQWNNVFDILASRICIGLVKNTISMRYIWQNITNLIFVGLNSQCFGSNYLNKIYIIYYRWFKSVFVGINFENNANFV